MEIPEGIRADYDRWLRFMEERVEFWHHASCFHTKAHCARVLRFALMIAEKRGLSPAERALLATASVFHDSRRLDDGYDTGHGQRAADYYRAFCAENGQPFDPLCYHVICWHDRHDDEGIAAIENLQPRRENDVLLYQIFKDADALDRFRLGPKGLDTRYLRTEEALELVDYARALWDTERR